MMQEVETRKQRTRGWIQNLDFGAGLAVRYVSFTSHW